MGEIVKVEQEKETDSYLLKLAKDITEAGFLPKGITRQQAFIIGQKGREIGVLGFQAMTEIYVIQGKPYLKAELQLQLAIERIPGFNYSILELTAIVCILEMCRVGRRPFKYEYTIEQAERMELASKSNWKKQPEEMLFNRCTTFMLRKYAPDYKSQVMFLFPEAQSVEAINNLTGSNVVEQIEPVECTAPTEVIVETTATETVEQPTQTEEKAPDVATPKPTGEVEVAQPTQSAQATQSTPQAQVIGRGDKLFDIKLRLVEGYGSQEKAEEALREMTTYKDKSGETKMVESFNALDSVTDDWVDRIYEKVVAGKGGGQDVSTTVSGE